MLHDPMIIQDFGTYNGMVYKLYRGRFTGETPGRGFYDVPYEIVAPVDPPRRADGSDCVFIEIPHFDVGTSGRSAALFEEGFTHATIGYSLLGKRALGSTVIANQGMPLPNPLDFYYWEQFTDRQILVDFVNSLKEEPLGMRFEYFYGYGTSDAANALNLLLKDENNLDLFNLSFPVIATSRLRENERGEDQGKVMVINAEADFEPVDGDPAESPNYRWYDIPGGSHIPGVPLTTPISWVPFLHALFVAGHKWAKHGIEPPPSQHLEVIRGQIQRDEMGNALGGIRHPALVMEEARFIARGPIAWIFGTYDYVRAVGEPGYKYDTYERYGRAWKAAVRALKDSKLLLGEDMLPYFGIKAPWTYTQIYNRKDWSASEMPARFDVPARPIPLPRCQPPRSPRDRHSARELARRRQALLASTGNPAADLQ